MFQNRYIKEKKNRIKLSEFNNKNRDIKNIILFSI